MTDAEAPVFGHLMQRADSLMLGKTECRRNGWQRMRWLDGKVSGYKFKQTLGGGEAWYAVHEVTKSQT